MRLPDFSIDSEWNQLRTRMGADRLGDLTLFINPNRLTEAELEILISGGIDIKSLDEVRSLADGTLAYKDRRVILYIRDISSYGWSDGGRGASGLPKYHVSNCKTLMEMRSNKRFGRYVVAARQDGLFQINRIGGSATASGSSERLDVCQNCLINLSFDGFSYDWPREKKRAYVSAFTTAAFFKQYPRDVINESECEDEATAPLNDYTGNFGLHADAAKSRSIFRCEECGLDCGSTPLRRFLHAHHVNGIKYDNRLENLKALCFECHSNQPMHGHMKVLPQYWEFRVLAGRR